VSAANWDHKDVWHRRGTDFLIEVKRHSEPQSQADRDMGVYCEGPHRWCVYAYIYPNHPHFAAFEGPHMWQDAATQLHLHGGPSLLEYPMYDGKVTCVKVGADYHHLHDERFTRYASREDAYEVFVDADELWTQLQTRADEAKAQGASR